MNKTELIEMLRGKIKRLEDPLEPAFIHLDCQDATDLLRELEDDWISVYDRLPVELSNKVGAYDNEDLVIILHEKFKSYEFAALTRQNGALVWDMPDHGFAEMSEVKYWKRFTPTT